MAKVDHLLQSGTKQIVLAVVAWLAHGCPPDSESRRRRNHEPPKSGIPKRKKTATHNRLSCKIEYLLRSNHGHSSIASEFFTGDSLLGRTGVCPSVITPEDQRVHHGHTLGMDDDWIEIDRIDVISMIGGKLGQPDHQLG